MRPTFRPGTNIAMKVPPHEYEKTVAFYRDVIGLPLVAEAEVPRSARFIFGGQILWIDCVASVSQAEIWLEIIVDDVRRASEFLNGAGSTRRDEIEALPEGMKAFWIANPANIIHLVSESS